MERHQVMKRVTPGMIAGLAGTAVIQGLQAVVQKKLPETLPPMKQHPGEYMVKKVEELISPQKRAKVPQALEKTAAQMLGVGYGLTFGVFFELLHRRNYNLLLEGTALGLACWAAGYLGWLPATGIMPSVTKQRPGQVAGAVVSHVAYGIATAGVLRILRRKGIAL